MREIMAGWRRAAAGLAVLGCALALVACRDSNVGDEADADRGNDYNSTPERRIIVLPSTTPIQTTSSGGTGTFTVVLTAPPRGVGAEVAIDLS